MNPELEGLLKAWDAFQEAELDGTEAKRRYDNYLSKLDAVSSRSGADQKLIHRLVKRAYLGWKRANAAKYPTVPPRA